METSDSVLLQEIDPRVLGTRLRAARLARGLTQTDLAGELCSVGYVSRLESGQRRPIGAVLEGLAARLDIAIDELLRGPTARQQDRLKLAIDHAELALETGDAVEAEEQARGARDRALALPHPELAARAGFLVALALERQGALDDAILELEPLADDAAGGILRIRAAIALSRCYRQSGDLGQAIDAAQGVLRDLEGTPLDSVDEAVQLAVTLAAAFYERGDTGQAVRVCRRAIDKAERLGSPTARASAYWNTSIMEAEQGSVRHAIPLAERALALLSEGQSGRNLARLRVALADMQLQLDPPGVAEAERQLDRAASELQSSHAGAIDLARSDLGLARTQLFRGETASAAALSRAVFDTTRTLAPLTAAEAKTVEGQAVAAEGAVDLASACYRDAVLVLSGLGVDRGAAQIWYELAGLLDEVDEHEAAREAYRSAAVSAGLRSRPSARTSVRSAIDQLTDRAIDQLTDAAIDLAID